MSGEYTLDMILDEVCRLDFEEFNSPLRHRFSLRNRIRINKLFSQYTNNICQNAVSPKKINRRFVIAAVIIIMLSLITAGTTALITNSFRGTLYNDNTYLFAVDIQNSPNIIEKEYRLSIIPEGYDIYNVTKTDTIVFIEYYKRETNERLFFKQEVKSMYSSHVNTEDHDIKETVVNGCNAIYIEYITNTETSTTLIWNNEKYILSLEGNFTKDELLNLAISNEINAF